MEGDSAGSIGVLFLGSEPRPFGSNNPEGREKVGHVALWVRSVSSKERTSAKSWESWMGSSRDSKETKVTWGKGPRESPWVVGGGEPCGDWGFTDLRFHSEWNGKTPGV